MIKKRIVDMGGFGVRDFSESLHKRFGFINFYRIVDAICLVFDAFELCTLITSLVFRVKDALENTA